MSTLIRVLSVAALLFAAFPSKSEAIPIAGLEQFSTEGLADFTGTFVYSFTDATNATIVLSLMNTTGITNPGSPADDGFLTAFAFNNPGDKITGVTVSVDESALSVARQAVVDMDTVLGGPGFSNGVSASPFGDFDIGVSTNGSWLGGGGPSAGIAVGETLTFTFTLTGTMLDTLDETDFRNERSDSPGGGGDVLPDVPGTQGPWNVARFRGITAGEGSDKVPGAGRGDPENPIPEPASLILLGSGLAGLAIWGRRKAN